jgi:hypothetical protein
MVGFFCSEGVKTRFYDANCAFERSTLAFNSNPMSKINEFRYIQIITTMRVPIDP